MNNGIIITNANKLDEAINAVERHTRSRRITSKDVVEGCRIAETRMGIPRKRMDGVIISVDINAQKFPKSYNGIPESTQFTAINRKGKWYVTEIYRGRCRYAGHEVEIRLTDAAKADVIRRVEGFYLV